MKARFFTLFAFALTVTACSAPTEVTTTTSTANATPRCEDLPFSSSGSAGVGVQASLESNLFVVPVKVGNTQSSALVDTGAPISILNPLFFPDEALPLDAGQGPGPSLGLDAFTIEHPTVVATALSVQLPSGPVPMMLGGDLLCHLETSFDYRGSQVFFGSPTQLPSALGALTSVPVKIEGGMRAALPSGQVVKVPATRIAVQVLVEGARRQFVLDTGASFTMVSQSLFSSLTADGRKTATGVANSVQGSDALTLTRVKSLSVAGVEETGLIVGTSSALALSSWAAEVGHPIDGVLGGSFLRQFFVTMNYRTNELSLRRYDTQTHWNDEFNRLGFTLQHSTKVAGQFEVAQVLPNSTAAQHGLSVGQVVLSIDGQALSSATNATLEQLFHGPVGTVRTVQTDSATLSLVIDDLLAL